MTEIQLTDAPGQPNDKSFFIELAIKISQLSISWKSSKDGALSNIKVPLKIFQS
jgi:hypothetical protein